MKLSKEEVQKLILSGILLIALIFGYFTMLLKPLGRSQAALQREIADLEPKIESANKQIRRTQGLEAESGELADELDRIAGLIPVGAPIAWFPPRVVQFFERMGVPNPTVRLAGDAKLPKIDKFKLLQWVVDLPKAEYTQLGSAMAAFENEEPLVRTSRLQITTKMEDPEKQHVILTVSNIVRNE